MGQSKPLRVPRPDVAAPQERQMPCFGACRGILCLVTGRSGSRGPGLALPAVLEDLIVAQVRDAADARVELVQISRASK